MRSSMKFVDRPSLGWKRLAEPVVWNSIWSFSGRYPDQNYVGANTLRGEAGNAWFGVLDAQKSRE